MSGTLYDANRMYAQISLSSKIYLIYIYIYIVNIYNTICRIITVEVYSAQNVLKDMIQVRNSGMSEKSASIACDVTGVRE